jgi:POT family proton-dependent oligopeptide transporter
VLISLPVSTAAVDNRPNADDTSEPPLPVTAFERRFGHPPGLVILFFTEMWERFSYYGMRGLLKLYMANYLLVTVRQTLQGKGYDGSGDPMLVTGWRFVSQLLPDADPSRIQGCIAAKAADLMKGNAEKHLLPLASDLAHDIAQQTCRANEHGSILYGWYTGLVYLTPLLGGYIADKNLGQRKTVVVGGAIMAVGHFVMALENSFFLALLLLILGNGAFKPNVSTQVGNLYAQGDPRRDRAYSIFYVGINLGAFICNFVCGTLAAVYGWHYGFAAAGFGMTLGLILYMALGQKYLAPDTIMKKKAQRAEERAAAKAPPPEAEKQPFTRHEWARIWALVGLCALNIAFWAVYEQQGNTMETWADENTRWPIVFGFQIPATWFQSVNPFCIFFITPLLTSLWKRQSEKGSEPSSVTKMALGCIILGFSFILMIIGARIVGDGQGSLFWPVASTLILTIGELYLSPIGLSLVTKVAPTRVVSFMMGMWFLSSFFGNLLCGYIGLFYTRMPKELFFTMLLAIGVAAGLAIFAFNRPLKKAIGHGV